MLKVLRLNFFDSRYLGFSSHQELLSKIIQVLMNEPSTYLKYLEGLKTRAADELNYIFDICTYDLYIVHGIL